MANNHSFYKEARKAFEAKEKLTIKSFFNYLRKYFKWFLYTFLTITTLWGCVNQFRHNTSQSFTQGMEFYNSYEEVVPNLYWGIQTPLIYQVVGDSEEIDGETSEPIEEKVLSPLNFYSFNPYYLNDEISDESIDKVDTTSLILKNSDITDSAGEKRNKEFAYTTSYLWGQNSLLKYDWLDYLNTTSLNNEIFITPWTPADLSYKTKYNIIENIVGTVDESYIEDEIISSLEFYEVLYNSGKINEDEFEKLTYILKDEDGEDLIDEDGNPIRASKTRDQAYLLFDYTTFDISDSSTYSNIQFNVVEAIGQTKIDFDSEDITIEDKTLVANNQSKLIANQLSFLHCKEIDVKRTPIEFFDNRTIEDLIVEKFEINPSLIEEYKVSFDPLQNFTYQSYSNNQVLQKGVGYTIVQQNRVKPLYPSKKTINELIEVRDEEWRAKNGEGFEKNYSKTNAGSSKRVDQTGWAILEKDSNETRWDNIKLTDNLTKEEKNLFAINQEEFNLFLEDSTYGSYGTRSDLKYSVELSESNIPTFRIGEEEMKVTEISDSLSNIDDNFMGIISSNDVNGTIINSSNPINNQLVSTLPNYDQKLSKLGYTIKKSGQSPTNSGRDIFTGSLSDWGQSWNPDYGPMYGLFVWPLSQLSLFVQSWFNPINFSTDYYEIHAWTVILGIFMIVFLLRGLGLLMSLGSHKNQHKMQEIQTQIAEIKAKYSIYDKSNKQMKQKQQQEIMALYRKNEVNPFSSIGTIFITMPIFLSLWTIISAIPAYKLTAVGNFSFGVSSFTGMFNIPGMFFTYLLVGIAVGMAQGISSKLPTWLSNKRKNIKKLDESTKQAQKKQNKTQNILIGVFIFMGLTVQVLLSIYWIFSALFSILNELVRHWIKEYKGL